MRADAGGLRDQDGVAVHERVARRRRPCCQAAFEELDARGAREARIVRREEIADVAERGGSEQRVDQGVADDVGVRVSFEAAIVLERHAPEHERAPGDEPVRVVARADAVAHPRGSWRASRPRNAVTVR